MRIIRYAATFLLPSFRSLPFRFYVHSSFPIAPNNVDDAVASFVTLLNKRNPPSQREFGQILRSLVKIKQYHTAVSLFQLMDFRVITPSLVTLSILINYFCHLGLMDYAFSALTKIIKLGHQFNVITLNTLMKGFCINNMVKEALEFHDNVRALGFQLDEVTYGTLINGICKIGQTRVAIKLLQKLEKQPVKLNVVTYSTVVDRLCKDGLVNEAKNLFSKMIGLGISPDVISYNSLIHGFCSVHQIEEATRLLHEMIERNIKPDIYTFNILIDALCLINVLCKEGVFDEAISLLLKMKGNGFSLDAVSYETIVRALLARNENEQAKKLLLEMISQGLLERGNKDFESVEAILERSFALLKGQSISNDA